jgi:peptide/nickel transport system permease protein
MSTAVVKPGAGSPVAAVRRAWHNHPVAAFVVRRVAAGLATLLVVSFIIFVATNALPGNVAQVVLGKNATPTALRQLEHQLGLDHSILSRYWTWLTGLFHGNLGQSAVQLAQGAPSAPVTATIGTPLRNSFELALVTSILLIPLSLLLGTLAALRAGRTSDYAISYTSLIMGSLPEFVLGTFLILIFFSWLNLFPPVSLIPVGSSPLQHPKEIALPILTLLGVSLAFCARQVRAGVLEALRQDYVTMARLGGVKERRVLWKFALRNALAPSVQTFAQAIMYLLGGIIVVETLFAYPGIGNLLVQEVQTRDVTEVQAIAMVLAAIYIAINILADLVVVLIVPRLRTSLS